MLQLLGLDPSTLLWSNCSNIVLFQTWPQYDKQTNCLVQMLHNCSAICRCSGYPGLKWLPRLSGTYDGRVWQTRWCRRALQNISAIGEPWDKTCVYVVEEPGAVGCVPLRDPVAKDQLLCRRNLWQTDQKWSRMGNHLFLREQVGSEVGIEEGRSTKLSPNHCLWVSRTPRISNYSQRYMG